MQIDIQSAEERQKMTQASSYRIWQKIKAKQPSDYELAMPLSVWCKTEPTAVAEYDALM